MERLTSKVLRKSWRFLAAEYYWLAADWLKELQNTSEELGGGELWSVSENHRKVSRVLSPTFPDPF